MVKALKMHYAVPKRTGHSGDHTDQKTSQGRPNTEVKFARWPETRLLTNANVAPYLLGVNTQLFANIYTTFYLKS